MSPTGPSLRMTSGGGSVMVKDEGGRGMDTGKEFQANTRKHDEDEIDIRD